MIDGALIFLGGMLFAGPFWLALAWRSFLRYEQPKIELKVTPEVLNQINALMVTQWLNSQGLVWMPKGSEFKWPKEKTR